MLAGRCIFSVKSLPIRKCIKTAQKRNDEPFPLDQDSPSLIRMDAHKKIQVVWSFYRIPLEANPRRPFSPFHCYRLESD